MVAYRAKTTLISASGTSLSLAIPSAAKDGDTLLAGILVAGGSGITITPPADWELALRVDSTTVISLAVYRHRYLTASALMIASWIQFNPTWRAAFEDAERVLEERKCLEEARREVESWFKEPVTYPTAEAGGHSGDP